MDVNRAFEISVSLDDELLSARSRAFSRLLIAIEDLREQLADVPAPSVPCTRRQYLAVLSDSDLNDTGQRAMETAARLDELPINDLHEIGGSCRAGLLAFIEDLRRVVGSAKEVAVFAPPADLAHMRQLQLDFAATTLSFGRALFQVLAAPTPEAVHKASEQTLDFNAAAFEELAGIIAAHDWEDDGPDERVSQVFALDGPWFDTSGFPDDAQIGFETSDTRAPVRRLGAMSAAYFQHVLHTPADEVGEVSLTLIPSARQLGLLERPLGAHRVALGVRRLLDAAWARDPEVTKRVIAETGEAEQLVYEARRRIALHLRRLAAGSIDPEELATGLMLTHKRLAEAARVHASQVLRLESVARTGADDPGAAQLLLGGLESRLNAVADPRHPRLLDGHRCDAPQR